MTVFALLNILLVCTACAGPTVEPTEAEAVEAASVEPEYAQLLFDTTVVHSIDIQVDEAEWDTMIATSGERSKEYIPCDLVIDGERIENIAIRCKGHSSMSRSKSTGKYSFKAEFDHYADGVSYHGLDKLSLNNLVADSSCMHDYIVYRLMSEFGVVAPLCSYAFVTLNGEDFGLYLAVEAVEDAFLQRNYGPEHGALYKPEGVVMSSGSSGNTRLQYIDDDPASYPNILGTAKTDLTRKDTYRLIGALRRLNERTALDTALDIDRVLRYFVIHSFVYNWDSYTGKSVHNYYLYEEGGRLSMIPWDYNEAFGSGGEGVNHPIDTPILSDTIEERPMLAWIFSDPAYTTQYHEMYSEFLDEFCDSGWVAEELARVRALIAPYVERDPRSFYSTAGFEQGVDSLLLFFKLRAQSVHGQLDGTIPSTAEGQEADSSNLIDISAFPETHESGGPGGNSKGEASGESSGGPSGESSVNPGGSSFESSGETESTSGEAIGQ